MTSNGKVAADYRLSGTVGHAPSTIAGKVAGMAHFNDFLSTKLMQPFDKLSESEVCDVSLWQQYGTYVSECAVNKKNGTDLLSWGTAKQVLSGPKAVAENKFGTNIIWQHQEWYTKIRSDIESTVVKRCIELGIPAEEKSEPVGRDLLLLLNSIMLESELSEQTRAIEYRAAINVTFAAVGRGGEVGYSSFNLCEWNTIYQSLFMLWQEKKTNKQKMMNFFCDSSHWEIDIVHSLACYFVVGAGSKYVTSAEGVADQWLFPFLETESASRKMTEYMRKLAEATNGRVSLDVSSTSLRVGSVAEVVNSTGDIVVATIRGGWGSFLASVATILEYYIGSHHTLSIGGRAIAGWPDPHRHVHAPSCDSFVNSMSASEKVVFSNFLSSLFRTSHFDILNSKIRPFAYCMFASLVQYLPQLSAKCGEKHVVVVNLLRAARTFGYTHATLNAWGKSVTDEWALNNVLNVDKVSDLGPAVTKLQQEIIALKAQNTELKVQNTELLQRADRADAKLDRILTLLTTKPLPVLPSPGSKRAREHSPITVEIPPPVAPSTTSSLTSPAPVVSVLAQLRAPSPKYVITGDMSLFDMYSVWFKRKYTIVNAAGKWDASKRVKYVIAITMKYTDSVMTQKLRDSLVNTPAPSTDDVSYAAWEVEYTKACRELVALVTNELNLLDKKKFRIPASLNAVGHRAPKL